MARDHGDVLMAIERDAERDRDADGERGDELLGAQHGERQRHGEQIGCRRGAANFMGGQRWYWWALTLSDRKLELQGSSATTGTVGNNFNDVIDLNNGAALQLDAGATFNDTTISGGGNALLIQSTAGTAGTVTNLGTWEKTGNSSGNDTISVAFSTTNGTVSVQAGTLNLSGGGTDTGATYSGAGTIDFGGGTRTLDATSSITANALFSGSETTTVNGTYNAASTAVSGGTASLAGTVTGWAPRRSAAAR